MQTLNRKYTRTIGKQWVNDVSDWRDLDPSILLKWHQCFSIQAGHQAPLQCCLPLIIQRALRAGRGLLALLVVNPPLQQVVEHLRYEPAPLTADRIVDLRDAGVRTARAADGLRRDVEACHHRGIHRREVQLADLFVQPHQRLVGQPAFIRDDQLAGRLKRFRLAFLPRDEDAVAHGALHLHGTDRRPGRRPRQFLHRDARQPRHLQQPGQFRLGVDKGVAQVDVPATV